MYYKKITLENVAIIEISDNCPKSSPNCIIDYKPFISPIGYYVGWRLCGITGESLNFLGKELANEYYSKKHRYLLKLDKGKRDLNTVVLHRNYLKVIQFNSEECLLMFKILYGELDPETYSKKTFIMDEG